MQIVNSINLNYDKCLLIFYSDYKQLIITRIIHIDMLSVCLILQSHLLCQLSAPVHVRLLRYTALLCAFTLFTTTTVTLLHHSDLDTKVILPNLLESYLSNLYHMCSITVLMGFVSALLAILCFGKNR